MTRFSTVVMVLGCLLALVILRAIRKESVRVEYSLVWLTVVIVFVGLVLSDGFMQWLAGLVGLGDMPTLILLLALVLVVLVSFHYAKILSRLRDDNIALVQRVAILQLRIQDLEKRSSR